jgi:predicted TIM-barrel fold metal-dependent hydrolase
VTDGDSGTHIVDSHAHAWERWPYLPPVPDAGERGRVEQLVYEMEQAGVDEAVLVCARIGGNDGNVDYAVDAQRRFPGRFEVFADVDCYWHETYHAPGAADRVRRLRARYPTIGGVAHYLEPRNDGWLRSSEGHAFAEAVAEADLVLGLHLAPGWHADLRALARDVPTLRVLCHHLGGLTDTDESAVSQVVQSSSVPNVSLKVSGLYYLQPDRSWDHPWPEAQRTLRTLWDAYGSERLCWGSDYPVLRGAGTYRQALEAVRGACASASDRELADLMGGSLRRLLGRRDA